MAPLGERAVQRTVPVVSTEAEADRGAAVPHRNPAVDPAVGVEAREPDVGIGPMAGAAAIDLPEPPRLFDVTVPTPADPPRPRRRRQGRAVTRPLPAAPAFPQVTSRARVDMCRSSAEVWPVVAIDSRCTKS
jgi:hypothetical protein